VTLISNPDVGSFLEAAATIVSRLEQKAVVVFYDKYQDHRLLEKLQQLLSDKSIPSLTFQIDDSASNLTSILRNVVWKRYRNTLVLCTPENVDAVLREARNTGTLKLNYFWTVIDTGVRLVSIEDLLPTNESANILVIRESPIDLKTASAGCTSQLKAVFPDCQMSKYSVSFYLHTSAIDSRRCHQPQTLIMTVDAGDEGSRGRAVVRQRYAEPTGQFRSSCQQRVVSAVAAVVGGSRTGCAAEA
uniref:ANF_receptor domain-containing protein n=1 Tax=Macrostomum lignano TaxID=282301 RepID=A0A1I8JI94_9PLAT